MQRSLVGISHPVFTRAPFVHSNLEPLCRIRDLICEDVSGTLPLRYSGQDEQMVQRQHGSGGGQ